MIDDAPPAEEAGGCILKIVLSSYSAIPFDESLNLSNPENTRILFSEGDSGGVLLDFHQSDSVYRVMFAAFDLDNRKQGLLRQCLAHAETVGIDIALVEVSDGSESPVWEKLGFTHTGAMGFSIVLSKRMLGFINYDAVIHLR